MMIKVEDKTIKIVTLEQYIKALMNGHIIPKQDVYSVSDIHEEFKEYKKNN